MLRINIRARQHGHAVQRTRPLDRWSRRCRDLVSQLVHDGMSVGILGRTMSAALYPLTFPRQRCPAQGDARATHDFEVMGLSTAAALLPLPVIFQRRRRHRSCKDQAIKEDLWKRAFTIGAISNEVISLNSGHLGGEPGRHAVTEPSVTHFHFFTEWASRFRSLRRALPRPEHLRTRPCAGCRKW